MRQRYPAIDRAIARVKATFSDEADRIGQVFANCIGDTLERTVKVQEDGSIYVITGDIPAMWLRDSACQLMPFIRFANAEPEIMNILVGLVETQVKCVLTDPYANAFNLPGERSAWISDKTAMGSAQWERKFEIDSLCHPVSLAYRLWKETGTTRHFTPDWQRAAETIIKTFRTEQNHETSSGYTFQRTDCPFMDTLSRDGKGALVKPGIGLIWSGFRPSDDACVYGYFIPGNMFAAVALDDIAEIAHCVYADERLAAEARDFTGQLRHAIDRYAIPPCTARPFYAYEVDGFGQYLIMDDANIPSLLSLPLLGWCEADDALYLNTRDVILSAQNPYYYEGRRLKGIGSPHTPANYAWDIAIAVQGLTSTSQREKCDCIRMMVDNDGGTGLMHEGVCVDDPTIFTRPWFSWANAMFCELVMRYCGI